MKCKHPIMTFIRVIFYRSIFSFSTECEYFATTDYKEVFFPYYEARSDLTRGTNTSRQVFIPTLEAL